MNRLLALCLLVVLPHAHAQTWTWAESGGAINPDTGEGVAVDASGDICVIGTYRTSATFGTTTLTSAGSADVFVARMSPDGTYLWATSLGGPTLDAGFAIDAHDGACYATGRYTGTADFGSISLSSVGETGDLFVAKLDSSGEVAWAVSGGGEGNETGHGIAADDRGGVVVSGSFSGPGTAQFGTTDLTSAGLVDALVARLDASTGAWLWATGIGSAQTEVARAVASGDDGTVTVAGQFDLSVTIGSTTLTSAGSSDVFVARYRVADGSVEWVAHASGPDSDAAYGVAVGRDGSAAITGLLTGTLGFGTETLTSAGLTDAFVARLSPDGEFMWARRIGGEGQDLGFGVAIDPAGSVFSTGRFTLAAGIGPDTRTAVGLEDAFVAAHSASGDALWSEQVGGNNTDEGDAIAIAPDGGVVVAGSFIFSAVAGPLTLSAPDENAFVGRLNGAAVPLGPTPEARPLALRIGPIPARSRVTVWLSPEARGEIRLEVVDAIGRVVLVRDAPADATLSLDVSALSPGAYHVRASGEAGAARHPLVVAR